MVTVGRMLARAAQQLHCGYLGRLLGHYNGVALLGPVGQVMSMMPTVGQALEAMQQMLHLRDRAAVVKLRQVDGHVALGYGVFEGSFTWLSLIQDAALMIALRIMQDLCGVACKPDALDFSHRQQTRPERYEHLTAAPCYFDSLNTELLSPVELLAMALPNSVQAVSYALLLSGKCSQAANDLRHNHSFSRPDPVQVLDLGHGDA